MKNSTNQNIFEAITNNKTEEAEEIINQEGFDINAKDNRGNTALHLAIQNNNFMLAKLLLEKEADANMEDGIKYTAFDYAITSDLEFDQKKELIKLFYEKANEENKIAALRVAASSGTKEVLELLIDLSIDSEIFKKALPLSFAISRYTYSNAAIQKEKIELLLQKGADVNFIDGADNTALQLAIASYNENYKDNERNTEGLEIIKLLIKYGADVNMKGKEKGSTPPLLWAISRNDAESLQLLLENGAKLTQEVIGVIKSRLFEAIKYNFTEKISIIFSISDKIKYGTHTIDGEKLTPIQYAIKHDKMDSLIAILENGYDKKYRKQLTEPLHMMVEKNNVEVVEKLIDSGADPMSWHKGKRSFHILEGKGEEYLKMLELFVKKGILNPYKDKLPTVAEANAEKLKDLTFAPDNECGNTPLHIALHKSEDLKTVLAENLDNINSKNANGKTPLGLAKSQEERLLLVENGADPKYITSKLTKEEKQELNNRYKDYQTLVVNTKKYLTHTFKTYPDSMQFSNRIQEVMFNDKNSTFQNLSVSTDEDKIKIDELAKRLFKDMEIKKSDLRQENIFKRFIDGLKKIFGLDKFNSYMSEISEEFKKGLEKMNKEKISLPSK